MEASALNELLECSVCFEVLDQSSKVLPCQHTFCRKCLEAIVSSKNELICPECRSVVKVAIKDLPPNVLLIRLLESMKISSSPLPVPNVQPHKLSKSDIAKNKFLISQSKRKRRIGKPQAIALYDYTSVAIGDLTFSKGDKIFLESRIDDDWLRGDYNGSSGVFPSNYVEIIVPLNDRPHTCKALFDFTSRSSQEDHCLFFKKGDEITVIRKVDSNWVEGELNGAIGMFPKSFVEFNEHSSKFLGISQNPSSSRENVPNRCDAPMRTSSVGPVEGLTKVYSSPVIMNTTRVSIHPSTPPTTTTTTTTCNIAVPTNKRHSVVSNRWSTDIGPTMVNGGNTLLYQAIYNYKPQKADELELIKNEYYHVTEHCRDGWYKGYSQSLQHGVFPGNYAKLFSSPNDIPVSVSHTKMITNVTQAVSRSLQASCKAVPSNHCSTSTSASFISPKCSHRLSASETHWYPNSRSSSSTESPNTPTNSDNPISKNKSSASKNIKKRKNLRSVIINRLSTPNLELRTNKLQTEIKCAPAIERKYKCIASYPAQSANEITLNVGDTLNVIEKRADGWMKGKQNRTGQIGFFPATFVQLLV